MTRALVILVAAYFLGMAVAVTYPGYLPANRIRPLVLGLPFSLFWQVLWISGAIAILGAFYLWEKRRTRGGSAAEAEPDMSPGGER